VLVGILLNQNSANRLDAKIDRLEARLNDRIDHLEARIDTLSKQLNDAILMLMGRDTDKSERLARLEERSKG
jgi:division protein CdvB (Snf7/Vps24/ESCRT-III family)